MKHWFNIYRKLDAVIAVKSDAISYIYEHYEYLIFHISKRFLNSFVH